jgi:cobalt-zinc-cadmium efflux system membrane fusion protein
MSIILFKMNKLIFIIFIVLLTACHNSGNNNQDSKSSAPGRSELHRKRIRGKHQLVESKNILARGDTVFVPLNSPAGTKLKFHSVESQEYLVQFTTTGVVKPLSGHLAEVTAPFEGRIVKSFIKLGQKVTTGTPLFEVSSSDYLESVRMCLQARRERELAEKNYIRKKDLMESGISSRKEFDEAKLILDLADKECEKTTEILKIFNINPDEADLTQPLIVRSPISGEVARTDITVGQYIKSDSDPIVTIADLGKIWVVARVKEKDLGAINPQDQVEVFTEGLPDRAIKGVVNYIGNIMNEQTRSVEVFIECENPEKILKSGMFVTVKFYHELADAIIIPSSSVLQDYNKSYLFVQAGQGTFVKREVSVTSIADKKLIVHSGLETGNIIVSEGGIYLR